MPAQNNIKIEIETLLDLLPLMEQLGDSEAVRWNNGYRTFAVTYRELLGSIGGCADHFTRQGLAPGDRILLWGENRPEWIAAFWAAAARGLQVVPIDASASISLVQSILKQTNPRLLVYSEHLDTLQTGEIDLPRLTFHALARLPAAKEINPVKAAPADTVEIVFTSGTTGNPRGVEHTHRNLCANLRPLSGEIRDFSRYLKYFRPVRVLSMLPFSHMFGQALGLFIPVMLGGAVVLSAELNPDRLVDLVRKEKALALVTVPGVLDGLRNALEARHGCTARIKDAPGVWGFIRRWLRFRDVHLRFGWRFLAIVSGGALLRPSLELWWSQLGFLVIQGYGLTEASPVVAMNNPVRLRPGSLGRPLKGQEVRIADDGEILVRGENVARYYGPDKPAAEGGWLRTGDLGRIDDEGNLFFLGRKKDVIVTRDGQNVHPEDVEARLQEHPGVAACAVVGLETEKGTEVHAVLVPEDPAVNPGEIIRATNSGLESHQRIRSWSLWEEGDLPRTGPAGKIRRHRVAEIVNRGNAAPDEADNTASRPPSLEEIVSGFTPVDPAEISDRHRLAEDLGIGSLDRIEMLARIEEIPGLDLDEDLLSAVSTWGDLKQACGLAGQPRGTVYRGQRTNGPPETAEEDSNGRGPASVPGEGGHPAPPSLEKAGEDSGRKPPRREPRAGLNLPRWINSCPARLSRFLFQALFIVPFSRLFLRLSVSGREHLEGLRPPAILAPNHTSHLDVPVLLAALPPAWRGRLAPAMLQDYFTPLLEPGRFGPVMRALARLVYLAACFLFKAYPFPQQTGGMRRALRLTGELAERGDCPLVFPEGGRSEDGNIQPFLPGIGLMARKLDLPVVPVRIRGLFQVLPKHSRFPRFGRVSVTFGRPVYRAPGLDDSAFARELKRRVKEL